MISRVTQVLLLLSIITSINAAVIPLEKRRVVTRVHTAPTNTVTDYYSTTTSYVIAPLVQFMISGDVTFTSTIYPPGVNPAASPTSTLTTVVQKEINPVLPSSTSVAFVPSPASSTPSVQTLSAIDSNMVENQATSSTPVQAAPTSSAALTPASSETSQSTTVLAPTSSSQAQQVTSSVPQSNRVTSTLSPVQDNQVQESQVTQNAASSSSSTSVAQPATSSSSTAPAASTSANSDNGNQLTSAPNALTYSPYNNDGSCKSADQVSADLSKILAKGVSNIRMYGTDCNSLNTVQPAAAALGIKINQGLWIDGSGVDSLDSGLQELISYGQSNGWDIFNYITIGNEAVNSGYCSAADLISKINSVKSQLQAAGYNGQVTTSEPPVSFENHPELCTSANIDFVGINPHSYFDVNSSAESSGTFVKGQVEIVANICNGKQIVVTETGYPSRGDVNGGNVPSKANQLIAVQAILNELNNQATILSTYDDYWKNPGQYGIEQFFGIYDLLPNA